MNKKTSESINQAVDLLIDNNTSNCKYDIIDT